MANWKEFDVNNPPKNWCLLEIKGLNLECEVLGRWSPSNYCWINTSLTKLVGYQAVERYMELDYPTLNDLIYHPRPKRPAPKVYGESG